ncbi:uncharacterized protein RCC_08295 [Ramularia collo-cygni]|uniref:NTF2-like domain-containing protein n=1 Tax=Ramularia collo-cygni TaxID=112498 RepID=A0A2D3V6U7_9PEZI|nr:uncharacterized protein RCC_08295 [Ramularia collo-cygni]CZT22425.1 uncharacterized protein RCC_08295 [Ramularia collo-cygni]
MRLSIAVFTSVSLVWNVLGAPDRPLKSIVARSKSNTAERSSLHHIRDSSCMDDNEAQQVATNFKNLIVEYSEELANSSLTVEFKDYSDSVIELINSGCPNTLQDLGTATFNSRAEFIAGQSQQPSIPWEQLNIWHTCTSVFVRWVSKGEGQEPEQVTGIVVLETKYDSESWVIHTVYSEFNSGAWLVNLGLFEPSCSA